MGSQQRSARLRRRDLPAGAGVASAAAGASPVVAVASAGVVASAGLSASFLLFLPLNKALILAFRSENTFGAASRCSRQQMNINKPIQNLMRGRENGR